MMQSIAFRTQPNLCMMALALLGASCTTVQPATQSHVQPTGIPPATESHIATSSPTSIALAATATPAPVIYRWASGPVLVMLTERPSFDETEFGLDFYSYYSATPQFLLYTDGRLIIRQDDDLWFKHLDQLEVCELLGLIDGTGFGIYDADTYQYTPFAWDSITLIHVSSWQANYVALPGLASWINNPSWNKARCPASRNCAPPIPPALRKVYDLLAHYSIDGMSKYEPDRLAMWVANQIEPPPAYAVDWPLTADSLADERHNFDKALIIAGETAAEAARRLPHSIGARVVFREGDFAYSVTFRPLFPYEDVPTGLKTFYPIPSADVIAPRMELVCEFAGSPR